MPRTSHVDQRSRRYAARQYVSESHDHKPDAPERARKPETIDRPEQDQGTSI